MRGPTRTARTLNAQGYEVTLWGKGVGTNGNDLIAVNPKTGEVLLVDTKWRTNPTTIQPTQTYQVEKRRLNAIGEAMDNINLNRTLSSEIKATAIQNLEAAKEGTSTGVRFITAGSGPGTKNSVIK